jgi:transcriptional regulator GlxA family with amidase domain
MRHTAADLASVTVREVARTVGWSERTLRRRFWQDTGMTWRQYLLHARLLRAMAMLAEPEPSVLEVATAVGFGSPGAFARSFRAAVGETPSGYRRRSLGDLASLTPGSRPERRQNTTDSR